VGPPPLCISRLTEPRLERCIRTLLQPEVAAAAAGLAARLAMEDGTAGAVDAFQAHMRACGMLVPPGRSAAQLADPGRRALPADLAAERAGVIAAAGEQEWQRLREQLDVSSKQRAAAARNAAAKAATGAALTAVAVATGVPTL